MQQPAAFKVIQAVHGRMASFQERQGVFIRHPDGMHSNRYGRVDGLDPLFCTIGLIAPH